MIVRTLIAAGAVLALAGPSLAQTAAKPTTSAEGMTLEQFQAANGDKLFARLDTNKDGKISPEEFTAFRKQNAKAPEAGTEVGAATESKKAKSGKAADRLFNRFDTDHDGFLSRTEANALLAWRFKRMDTNNDGRLTLEELQAKGGKAKVGV